MTEYLYSGSDPTPRDEVIPRRKVSGRQGFAFDSIARTAASAAFALSSVCTVNVGGPFTFRGVHVIDEAPITIDRTIDAIVHLRSDGEQPTEESRATAAALVGLLRQQDLEPSRVLADSEGGVALYVFGDHVLPGGGHSRYARIVATNAGEVAVLCADRREPGKVKAWDVHGSEERAMERVRSFIEET
jgi:hypothetical protein